ncbi:hypothetical protein [Herbiconiux sp. VKM Ac-2851]|uniref:hypothetical protein n=1 Tax=Herbiconiux sp. VKM Ac-2851 TaxID=2739025 RepID=UPI001567BD5C|nr:hypothetical protein [Herbiconiux sp. VKM Ac-2851]NQX35699.1 hypothetical protein [Herbiconiux sp. VKM Ac-2851]
MTVPLSFESTIGEVMADAHGRSVLGTALQPLVGHATSSDESLGIDMAMMTASIPVGRALKSFIGIGTQELDELRAALEDGGQPRED